MTIEPQAKKTRGISVVWILPVIALCICGWLLYSSYKDAGVEIVIKFDDASGIVPGKTQVMARGIPVGLVKKIVPDLVNKKILTTVEMDKVVAEHLVEDTLFWVVRPELSASSVRGLDTILSGSYIGIQVGTSKIERTEFDGLASPPPVSPLTPGLHLQLRAEVLGSVQVGTGVYYRNIEIGKVQKHQLKDDDHILIDIFIEPQFRHLVRAGSRFCNASGIQISGKLPNLKVNIESFASILKGGILLHTPEQLKETPGVTNGHEFKLYPDYESANYGIPMTLTLASGKDIVEGATKVMYRGLEAGIVKEIQIDDNEQRSVTAHILIDPRAELILRENTKFWLVKPGVSPSGINNLSLLLAGAHITFKLGDGAYKNHFNILPEPPPEPPGRPGRSFVLVSEDDSEVSPKSPIYFKNIKVGEVINIELNRSGRSLETYIYIYQEYLHLLSTKSVFWEHSGVEFRASLDQGVEFSTGPLAKLVRGGISFTTPDKIKKKKNYSPEEGHTFQLFESYRDAVKDVSALQKKGRHIQVISKDASSLSTGAPILHKNIKIGEIEGFTLTDDQQKVLVDCFIYKKYEKLVHDKTRFYNTSGFQMSGGLNGIKFQTGSMHSIIAGGIGCINLQNGSKKPRKSPYPLYENLHSALHADKVKVEVTFSDTKGIKEGSPVRYKGIIIGKVYLLNFDTRFNKIVATIAIDKSNSDLFRETTRIWVAEAEINLTGVKNVETIVFGSFLNILPGQGKRTNKFVALDSPPRTEIANQSGLGIVLDTRHLGSLSVGSPVYYRQVQVGEVTGYELSPTFQKVHVFVSIQDQYRSVIRTNSRFWNVSGARIEGGLFSGLTIATESIEAIMKGGVAFATPDKEETGPVAAPGTHFALYEKPKKEWLDWNPDVVLLELEDSKELLEEVESER